MRTSAIVVGVDGTESSRTAVEWAAREAKRRRLRLLIVHAYDWDWHETRFDVGNEYVDVVRQQAESFVSAAARQALEAAPGIDLRAEIVVGHAATRLLAAVEAPDLVVLGSRGRGGFAGLLLGSVSQRVAMHAPCPAVVVRGRVTDTGPVVAGIEGSSSADHVLQAAFDAAADRGTDLLVIRAIPAAVPHRLSLAAARKDGTPGRDAVEQARLDELLEPWRAKYPEVPIGTILTRETSDAAVVAASRTAQLVIVSASPGPAGLQVLHHAECPVYLARSS